MYLIIETIHILASILTLWILYKDPYRVFLTWTEQKNIYTSFRWFNMVEAFIVATTPIWLLQGKNLVLGMVTLLIFFYWPIIVYRNDLQKFKKYFKFYLICSFILIIVFIIIRHYDYYQSIFTA